MKNCRWLWVVLVLGMLLMVSCAKKKVDMADGPVPTDEQQQSYQGSGRLASETGGKDQKGYDSGSLDAGKGLTSEAESMKAIEERERFVNEDIYFDFDSFTLTSEAQDILRSKAEWLRSYPNVSVTIEGHCDERGTNEYNMALGEKRAQSVKQYLLNLGIAASRMTPLSYGEERPIDPANTEEAWSKNRRGHFILKQ